MNNNVSLSNVRCMQYNEAAALQQLLQTASSSLACVSETLDKQSTDTYDQQFCITVGGVQTAFQMGGPQFNALCKFIQTIADENLYAVDFDKETVTD